MQVISVTRSPFYKVANLHNPTQLMRMQVISVTRSPFYKVANKPMSLC